MTGSNGEKHGEKGEVIDFAAARKARPGAGPSRQTRKEKARAEKAATAAANRARTGRTKAQKINDRRETERLRRDVDGARRESPDDDA